MFYSDRAAELRSFFKEKLKLPCTDVGEGWLIFDFKEADMGVDPTDSEGSAPSGTHDISFYCDDIRETVADLKKRGVTFTEEIADHGYALVTHFEIPGGGQVQLYEPRYKKKTAAKPARAARPKKARRAEKKKVAKKRRAKR